MCVVVAFVPGLPDLDPGSLPSTHRLEACIEVGVVAWVVYFEHVGDFALLLKVDQLAIAEPRLVLVVHDVARLGERARSLDYRQHLQVTFAGYHLTSK